MATLPDQNMKDVATQIIEILGVEIDFERRDSEGVWNSSAVGVKVYVQPSGAPTERRVDGISTIESYFCLAPSGTDIVKGDRCVLGGIYCAVISLRDIGTHLELQLMGTNKRP